MGYMSNHFSHEHPLILNSSKDTYGGSCCICQLPCHNCLFYSCARASCYHYYLHKTCSELAQEINHPFHSQHPLTLYPVPTSSGRISRCDACGKSRSVSTYHCPTCQFDLDLDCAALMPTKRTTIQKEVHDTISYDGKPQSHSLFLCETDKDVDFYCSGCKLVIENGSIYVCLECKYLLDKSCAKLPKKIRNRAFHPDHTLTLLSRPHYSSLLPSNHLDEDPRYFRCSACGLEHNGLSFHCFKCQGFGLDVNCAFLMPANTPYDHLVNHNHPLILCTTSKNNKFIFTCYACHLPFNDGSIYCCLICNLLLHKLCAELPSDIEHIVHPQHPLKLIKTSGIFRCNACLQKDKDYAYECLDCHFRMDTRCGNSTPITLNSQLHNHPLAFFTFVESLLDCKVCKRPIWGGTNFFRCVTCDFNVHLLCCIPTLPPTASDGIHRHRLTLTQSPIKDYEDENEYSEFLCDTCEKKRRLHETTYYCAECHYVAHVHCVISELVRFTEENQSLARNLGDTKSATSTDLVEGKTTKVVSRVRIIEEVEGTTSIDENLNGDKAKKTSTQINYTSERPEATDSAHSSLVDELYHEEIEVLRADIKEQEIKLLKASKKKLEELEKKMLYAFTKKEKEK